ncbi:MAG: glycosyltransferase family 1 protein [Kiritimatiellia bacterium]
MPDKHNTTNYLFDARRATPLYPEANRYCRSILPVLAKLMSSDEHLHIIAPQDSQLTGIHPGQKVTIHRFPTPPDSFKTSGFVRKLTRTIKPDIYHSATLLDSIRSKKIRSVATIHRNCPLDIISNRSSFREKLWFRLQIRPHLKRFHTFIAVSTHLARTYSGTAVENRSEIIHYGVDKQFRKLAHEDIDSFREKYKLPEKFLLIIVAQGKTHNLNTVLDAFQSTDFTGSMPLIIAGYGSKAENVTKIINQKKLSARIHQLGAIKEEDMPALYNSAFALLFPNIIKGTGLPVMESMACGTPVICSSLPTLTELTDGAATLVHPTCVQEWKRAISTALVSIKWHEDSCMAALERAKSFSWENSAEQTLRIYRGLWKL